MDEKIRAQLVKHCKKNGWDADDDNDLHEVLFEIKAVNREEIDKHRWWNEYRYTINIDDMLIGYVHAEANRDESVDDLGYEFDPDTICLMRRRKKIVTVYTPF
jgi:hypothetical protein